MQKLNEFIYDSVPQVLQFFVCLVFFKCTGDYTTWWGLHTCTDFWSSACYVPGSTPFNTSTAGYDKGLQRAASSL